MLAALNGHAKIVKKLLEKKSDIDYRNTSGETSLYLASYSGRNEIVDILLKANANPNIYTCKHWPEKNKLKTEIYAENLEIFWLSNLSYLRIDEYLLIIFDNKNNAQFLLARL